MERQNSMENTTIATSMVIKKMDARRNQNVKESVTNARNKVTRHLDENLNHSVQLNNW